MQCYSFIYQNKKNLEEFIYAHHISTHQEILIQVFTGINDYTYIDTLRQELLHFLPHAKIIGATTSGEISSNQTTFEHCVITFCLFENTHVQTLLVPQEDNSFSLGSHLMQTIQSHTMCDEFKLLITFTDGLNTNAEEYLKGLTSINSDVIVAGGMAGDNASFKNTYVFNEHTISNRGAVGAALFNKNLNVFTDYNFSWQCLGKSHTVEHSHKNRVYTIDGKSAVDFYAYYLGEEIASMLPNIGIEFPLVIQKDGLHIARAVLNKYEDGSLGFAGNVPQGSQVKFGYGDIQMILHQGLLQAKNLAQHPLEAIFVYSCMARKSLLKEEIDTEIKPLQHLACTSGFFTYGEFFYTQNGTRLMNQTMTILALSESHIPSKTGVQNALDVKLKEDRHLDFYRTKALSQLISKTTYELEQLNETLEQRVQKEVQKSLEKDEILFANARHAQMGEILDMIVHQWRQPLNVFSAGISSLQVYNSMGLLTNDVFEKTTEQILNNVEFLNNTIKDFRSFFKDSQLKEHIRMECVVDKSLVLIESLIKKFGVKLIKEIRFEEELYICTSELIQVILNIFKNSIDAIEENSIRFPEIYLKIYEHNCSCVIEIADNAGGIPLNILPKIFEKRFTTKGETHGTGIGLDMSKTIIETHFKGTLVGKNNEQGATFIITIPLQTTLE
jgi:nitrogen-specific signal transduction histidine kinase